MNLLLVADGHYYQTRDGKVYADSVYDYDFYRRYLSVFDHVYAVIRAIDVDEVPVGKKMSSGEGVSFLRLPAFHGPYEYLRKHLSVQKAVKSICKKSEIDCAVFRIPAATSNLFCPVFAKMNKPFAVEVVTDPWENFGPRAAGNIIMLWFVRRNWTRLVKRMCQIANGASYVTEHYLQEKYPPRSSCDSSNKFFTASYSSVELKDGAFCRAREWKGGQKSFTIAHVSNYFSGNDKGHLTLLRALKIVRENGYDANLIFVGDGPKKAEFEEFALSTGVADHVKFVGRLANGDEVRKMIHNADLFVLPTFAEGLPRVLLEAMSEGIPCLSSPVCGIPEIIDDEFLYDFDDYKGFADGMMKMFSNPELMTSLSHKNLEISKRYSNSILNEKRTDFYAHLRDLCDHNEN